MFRNPLAWFFGGQKTVTVTPNKDLLKKLGEEEKQPQASDSLIENNEDPYGGAEEEIRKFNEDSQKLLDKWIEKKLEIAGLDKITKHEKQPRMTATGELTLEASVADYLKAIFIKGISTPHQNMEKDIEQDHPLIQSWGNKIKELFKNLAETKDENQEQKRKIKLEICDAAIHMIEEIMKMVSDINKDLFICDSQIKGLSTAGSAGIKALLLVITGMSFPSTDFGIEKFLRNEAYLNMQEDKKFVELEVTQCFATLIENYEQLNNKPNDKAQVEMAASAPVLTKDKEEKKVTKEEVEKLKEVKLSKFGEYSLQQLNKHKLQNGILHQPLPEEKQERRNSFSGFSRI